MKNPRPLAFALLVSLASPFAAPLPVAFAQNAADDASTKLARQRFQEGVAFFDKGQYELARASFLQAYALRKHPAVLLNLGLSSLKAGHTLEAAKYLTQFLREHTGASVAQRTDADKGLREARVKLGRIDVAGVPPGTDLYIDDERVGTAPLDQPADVEPGTHMVRARGRLEDAVQITVNAGAVATARFGMATPPPAVVAPPPATQAAPPAPAEEPAAPPPASETPPAEPSPEAGAEPAKTESRRSLLSPPNNVAPVVVGGVLSLAGFATAIAFYAFKKNAQDSYDTTQAAILGAGVTSCNPKSSGYKPIAADACASLSTDTDRINSDALIGNIGLGVGIGALAFTTIYWFAASRKTQDAPPASTASAPSAVSVTPLFGHGLGGLSVSGSF